MLIDIDNAIRRSPLASFVVFPLPMKKVLWEAPNAEIWSREIKVILKDRELFGLGTDGQLKRVGLEHGGMNITTAGWENWCAEMDSFGTLAMMASSLL